MALVVATNAEHALAHSPIPMEALQLARAGSNFVINPDPHLWGDIYTVFRGTFGNYRSVFIKTAEKAKESNGKTHRHIVQNDLDTMQLLAEFPSFARAYHCQQSPTHVMMIVQAYHEHCEEYVRTIHNRPVADQIDEQRLFRELFTALGHLHSMQLVHRNLRLKNLFIHRYGGKYFFRKMFLQVAKRQLLFFTGTWQLVVGGLKYVKPSAQIQLNNSGPLFHDVYLPMNYSYGSDKYQAMFVMYCFLRGQVIPLNAGNPFIYLEFPGMENYTFRQLHLKHLVGLLYAFPDTRIPDILTHPYFMSYIEMIGFEDRMRGYSALHHEMDPHMELGKVNVYEGQWTTKVHIEVLIACGLNTAAARARANTFVGLWQARRNRRAHRDADSLAAQGRLGPMYAGNFIYWETRFPAFFLHLFLRLIDYRPPHENTRLFGINEFRGSEFFPASSDFYTKCAATDIYGEY